MKKGSSGIETPLNSDKKEGMGIVAFLRDFFQRDSVTVASTRFEIPTQGDIWADQTRERSRSVYHRY